MHFFPKTSEFYEYLALSSDASSADTVELMLPHSECQVMTTDGHTVNHQNVSEVELFQAGPVGSITNFKSVGQGQGTGYGAGAVSSSEPVPSALASSFI